MAVYFIKSSAGHIKIGYARSPLKRLATLQTGSPYRLELVWVEAGGIEDERRYHRLFDEYRGAGEWFDCRGRLAAFLATDPVCRFSLKRTCDICEKRPAVVGRACARCAIRVAMGDPAHIQVLTGVEALARGKRFKRIVSFLGVES